ncbi:MAG: DUF4392 domain-containing protein [Lachnospiraceae bacterium]|nr:DUF4392 domain-containing protein [Lachnospiraceae bacterium]
MHTCERIEDIILRHSKRGMDILSENMDYDCCHEAARLILSWDKGNVFLTTGFYANDCAETDGPAGTVVLAKALQTLGYHPVIITDKYCKGFFEIEELDIIYMPVMAGIDFVEQTIGKYNPVGMISIERCGRNADNDYANMKGISIKEYTAKTDLFFEAAAGKISTIGIGDGGNEIGMGNAANLISEKIGLVPCIVCVDCLVIATVSNWGAYGVATYLGLITGRRLMAGFEEIKAYISKTVGIGSVDGVLGERIEGVDGFGMDTEKEIVDALCTVHRHFN